MNCNLLNQPSRLFKTLKTSFLFTSFLSLKMVKMKFVVITTILLFFVCFIGQSQTYINMPDLLKLYGDDLIRAEILQTPELTVLNEKEELTLKLFTDFTVIAKKTKSIKYPEGYELWQGDLLSGEGYVQLFSRKGLITGTVYAGSKVYKLDGTTGGSLRVIELNTTELSDHLDEDTIVEANSTIRNNISPATASNPSIIDVMIVYPPSVQNAAGGAAAMENEVYYRIEEANEVFSNSNIFVEFRLVHHQVVRSVDEDAGSSSDVKTDEVEDLRDQYKADLVSFWNKDGATGSGSNFNSTPGDPKNGFNTSKFSAVQSQYTFIHECGHNMGAKHDRQTYYDDSPTNSKLRLTPYYRYGKSFLGYRSVMSYNSCRDVSGGSSGDCERVPYFTNPNITVNGAPFGVEGNFQTYNPNGPANNAQRINEVAPFVAAYYINTLLIVNSYNIESVQIYPNPVISKVTIQGAANSTICVYNTSGKMLLTKNISNDKEEIDLSEFSTGIYYAKVYGLQRNSVLKLVKQ